MIQAGPIPEKPKEEHFQISEKALQRLAQMADGNGIEAKQIKLIEHDTIVHTLIGKTHITITPNTQTGGHPGQKEAGQKCADKQDAIGHIQENIANLLQDSQTIETIATTIKNHPQGGWGADKLKIKLPHASKEYCTIESCPTCKGMRTSSCVKCQGKGQEKCYRCRGLGRQHCKFCSQSGQIKNPDGSSDPCKHCDGRGQTICLECQGDKQRSCTTCKGKGNADCQACQKTGFWTTAYHATYEAELSFSLDKTTEILPIIDSIGIAALAKKQHIEIFGGAPEIKESDAFIPLTALFPVSKARISIEGKAYDMTVTGLQGSIFKIEPFLNDYIKPGINALIKLTKGNMATQTLVDTACKYRILRETLSGVATHTNKYVYNDLKHKYPKIISKKYLQGCIKYANAALLALGQSARLIGLGIGTGLSAGLSALWFMFARAHLINETAKHALLLDVAVWGLGWLITFFAIKVIAAKAVNKFLPKGIADGKLSSPAGIEALYAVASTLIIWGIIAFLSPDKPMWLSGLL